MTERFDYHAKGQKDATEHNYDPPHSSVAEQLAGFFHSSETNEREIEDRRAYDSGYEHAKNQRD